MARDLNSEHSPFFWQSLRVEDISPELLPLLVARYNYLLQLYRRTARPLAVRLELLACVAPDKMDG